MLLSFSLYSFIMKVILDTDFLVNCMKFKIDIDTELRKILTVKYVICVVDKTIDELEGLDNGYSKMALKWLDMKNVEEVSTAKNKVADDLILELNDEVMVATQDKEFKRRLKEKGVKTIIIRQEKYLRLD